MANNYMQFSEVIAKLSAREKKWLENQLEVVYVFAGKEYSEDSLPAGKRAEDAEFSGCRVFRDMEDYSGYDGAGFEHSFDTDSTRGGWGRHLWIYTEESGDLEQVAHLVQKFLQKFRPTECWSLTYSETCSKPRVGEFGGGALFVTADAIKWQTAYSFIAEERRAFEQAHA